MSRLEKLLRAILARWSIPAEGVIAHSDLAPGRKADPGRRFDWMRLTRQGLAAPIYQGPSGDAELQALGYTADVAPQNRFAAYQLRHGPWVTHKKTGAAG